MSAFLFDPLAAPPNAWPPARSLERDYIEGLARTGLAAQVANVRARWFGLRSGERVYPVTVNDGEHGDSYVCLPHSAYVLYGRRELALVDVGAMRLLLRPALAALDGLLRALRINRIVHIDNWLLSTNLHGDWDGADARALREAVQVKFPRHWVAVRSVDPWSSPALDAALRADGWVMLPSRQVWVVDDAARQWRRTSSVARDRAALRRSGLVLEDLVVLRPGEAERIAALYRMLYVDKYSGLNPVFTPAWIEFTHRIGAVQYRVARSADGTIHAVAGNLSRAGVLTSPIVGYDTAQPLSTGLYRIAAYMFSERGASLGVRLHASAGAADFKRARGARAVIECTAIWAGGAAPWRRALLRGFAWLLWRFVVPLMQRRQL